MSISAAQRRQIEAALLSAFDLDGLRRLVRYVLELDLDSLSTGDMTQRVADVVDHAERIGRLADLIAGAVKINPGNEQIQLLIAGALGATFQSEQKKTSVPA